MEAAGKCDFLLRPGTDTRNHGDDFLDFVCAHGVEVWWVPVCVFEGLGLGGGEFSMRGRERLDGECIIVIVEGGYDIGWWDMRGNKSREVDVMFGRHREGVEGWRMRILAAVSGKVSQELRNGWRIDVDCR